MLPLARLIYFASQTVLLELDIDDVLQHHSDHTFNEIEAEVREESVCDIDRLTSIKDPDDNAGSSCSIWRTALSS